jgi:predicted ferric reductase
MFTTRAHVGRLGMAYISGDLLILVLTIMFVSSMKFVRRGGHFELFYWVHLLFIVFYALLILHARNFWFWFIVPGAIYCVEKIITLIKRRSASKGRTFLRSATIEEANVIKLSIYRPPQFNYTPGDYVIINIPQVARFEWHPFTISSAPEDTQVITVHIQAVGNWTKKVFNRYNKLLDGTSKVYLNRDHEALTERVLLDGPYASSARYIFNSSHAILIGAGIGKLTLLGCHYPQIL